MYPYKFRNVSRMIELRTIVTAFDDIRPPDFYFSGEMHNFWEMVCVFDGKAMVTAEERVYLLSAGQIVFHQPMEFHRVWAAENTTPRLLIISFEAAGDGMQYFKEKTFSLDRFERENVLEINAAFRKVIELSDKSSFQKENYDFAANRAALLFENFLFGLYGRGQKYISGENNSISDYEQIVRVLNEHYHEPLTIRDIAQLCQLSQSNLKRIFHLYNDKGIIKYFTSVKMRKAMQWLDEGKTVLQISDALGFSGVNYFHAVFKRETGLTPREYQKGRK